MYSKRKIRFFRTATFRLTLWYSALLAALLVAAFSLVYLTLASSLLRRVDAELTGNASEFAALYGAHGPEALGAEFEREAQSRGTKRAFYRLISSDGGELVSSDLGPWRGLGSRRFLPKNVPAEGESIRSVSVPGRRRKVRVICRQTGDGNVIQIGYSLRDYEETLERYRVIFAAAVLVLVACGGGVGWFVARRAMRGVERVTQTAVRIRSGEFARRVPLGGEGQEIEDLATAFNEMLERIESLLTELRQVTSNIAHDLRSPVTGIRGIAETTLTGGRGIEDYREMAATVIEESDRLVGMIDTMLEIAEVDSGVVDLARTRLDMGEVCRSACELFQPVAEEKGVGLELSAPPGPAYVLGDLARLQRAVANLLDNAIKYTPAGGRVEVAMAMSAGDVSVSVSDSGVGIDEKDLPHVFERFYRGEGSRSTPGNGLGLSLARATVRAHGGRIAVQTAGGEGTTFTILLPHTSSSP